MKENITYEDLVVTARQLGLSVSQEQGGYRVMRSFEHAFPAASGLPAESKRACGAFILGVRWGREHTK